MCAVYNKHANTDLQCTMVGALLLSYFFLASRVAVTNPTNRATLGNARSFHEVNFMCDTSREEEGFCSGKLNRITTKIFLL